MRLGAEEEHYQEFESTHLEVGRSHDRVIYDTNTRVAIGRFE